MKNIKPSNLNNKDELVFTGKQLKEWNEIIIKETLKQAEDEFVLWCDEFEENEEGDVLVSRKDFDNFFKKLRRLK